jgi:hypothetical protein
MRFAVFLLVVGVVGAADKLSVFGQTWAVPAAPEWRISEDNGSPMLQLLIGREPAPGPRRPSQYALMEMPPSSHVTLEADARPTKRSLMIVYAYQDDAHFDYVHFSTDEATKQPVHNGVFHVFGGERVRISAVAGPPAFSAVNQWFHIKVEWDGKSGQVQGFVNALPVPALHAVDLSLSEGKVGIGSFDETGDFKNVSVRY